MPRRWLGQEIHNFSVLQGDLGNHDQALLSAEEALRSLAPSFLEDPHAIASQMKATVRRYLETTAVLGSEPESDRLDPIVRMFRDLGTGEI